MPARLFGWVKRSSDVTSSASRTILHNEAMLRMADQMGMLVWEEVPVYWTIQWENPETLRNAENQLDEMITRDHNRAAFIIYSVGNETPIGDARNHFLSQLIHEAHTTIRATRFCRLQANESSGTRAA